MVVRVKICGITRLQDALAAAECGADAVGFVFAPSPRRIDPAEAGRILADLPPFLTTVGLVVDQDPRPILDRCSVDLVQFHGSEEPATLAPYGRRALKAIHVTSRADLAAIERYPGAGGFVLDTFVRGVAGGTGRTFPWELAAGARAFGRPILVAGGLTPENVAECIRVSRPYGVDVSSGVESAPGVKDPERMRRFLHAVRAASEG